MTPNDLVFTPKGVRFQNHMFPCSFGRGGLSTRKAEGDGATPTGVHSIVGMLYRPDRLNAPMDWAVPIGRGDLWSDDVKDPDYNTMVRAPHSFRHERLYRSDPLYDLVLITNWNWPYAVKGRGSAIFIHQWRRPGFPTEGCIAVDRGHLLWIAQRLSPRSRLIVTL